MTNTLQLLNEIFFTEENIEKFTNFLNAASLPELLDLIQKKSFKEQLIIFKAIPLDRACIAFAYLANRVQEEILQELPLKEAAVLVNALSPDDRTSLLKRLPADEIQQLLKYLTPEIRALSITLLGYPKDSIGSMMTPDYIAIKIDWTIRQVLDHIRENGKDSETINIVYAVDDQGHLVDDFRIRQFLLASPETKVSELTDRKFIALHAIDHAEQAIRTFRRFGRTALPVVDDKNILLGIVTFDDIMALAVEVDTEDIQKIGGVEALGEPYLDIGIFSLIQKRAKWLVVLFLGELLTASVMGFYEHLIAQTVILALFLPLIISSGGNAGSQASTLIIRALALGEVSIKNWWQIIRREVFSGFILGATLGSLGFLRVALWSLFSDVYGPNWLTIAFIVSLSLTGVVLWGSLSGAVMPLVLNRCGLDPAVSSAPLVATLVDVTGLMLYFSIAALFIHSLAA